MTAFSYPLHRTPPPAQDPAQALDRAAAPVLQARRVLSPLRYPGGKRRLVPYVAETLAANSLRPDLFVEPFAGGASVSLELLDARLVDRIGIADMDPMVAAFWETVFFDADWLCKRIEDVPVDLETWTKMKRGKFRSRRSLALACLFLNRTSFNGALHRRAGPIGGKAQRSAYAIDCRFPRATLIRRVRACEELADSVDFVRCEEAKHSIEHGLRRGRQRDWGTFFYLDPPFWAKSDYLYRHSFQPWQHDDLAQTLLGLRTAPWLLSYDPAPEIEALYAGQPGAQLTNVDLLYVGARRSAGKELVVTNLRQLPRETTLWRTAGTTRPAG